MRSETLSLRLRRAAEMVSEGGRFADIGTDHGYLPIYLVNSGRSPGGIAADVNEGPLEKAREHIKENHLENRIDTVLSDGLSRVDTRGLNSLIIAGMGGQLMIRILGEGSAFKRGLQEMILLPQSDADMVRRFIYENGFHIDAEDMVFEDGKYYVLIKAVPGREEIPSETELLYGPCLIRGRNDTLRQYLERERLIHEEILSRLERGASDKAFERRSEVMDKLEIIKKLLG